MDDFAYGWEGGQSYLNEVLKIKDIHDKTSKDLRDYIGKSFQKLNCFLMPHPGFKVFDKKFDGRHSMLGEDFVTQLKSFVPELLENDKLTVKGMYLRPMKAAELYRNICNYITLFKSDVLPEPKSIYQTMLDTQLACVVENCINIYRNLINEKESLINKEPQIENLREEALRSAMCQFMDLPKMGNIEDESKYKQILIEKLDLEYEHWKRATIERLKREEAERIMDEERKRYAEALQKEQRRVEELENERRFPVRFVRECQNSMMNPLNLMMAIGVAGAILIIIF